MWGAGIFSEEDPDRRNDGLLVYPEDTIFEDNIGEVRLLCQLDM